MFIQFVFISLALFVAEGNAQSYKSHGIICKSVDDNTFIYQCAATLVSKYLFMTLATCISENTKYQARVGYPDKIDINTMPTAYVRVINYNYNDNYYINNYGLLIFHEDMSNNGEYKIPPFLKTTDKINENEKFTVNTLVQHYVERNIIHKEVHVFYVKKNNGFGGCQSIYDRKMVTNQTLCADVYRKTYYEQLNYLPINGTPIYRVTAQQEEILVGIVLDSDKCYSHTPMLSLLTSDNTQEWVNSIHEIITN